jgi:hypothetical protein
LLADLRNPNTWELTESRVFISHGVAVGIRASDPMLLARAQGCLPPGWGESFASKVDLWFSVVTSSSMGGGRVLYTLFEDERKLAEGFRLTRLMDAMESAIRLQVGRRAPMRLFVHAGAVAWRGSSIVIPGRSGTGKTSLVAALVKAGATYYSDEYAVLDGDGLLHPYTRPLSFRLGVQRRTKKCAVADLGGSQARKPVSVGLVLHTRFRPDVSWTPRVLSSGEGALALFDNTLGARERPAFAFSVLSNVVSKAVALRGDRNEAETFAAEILSYVDSIRPIAGATSP